MYRVTHLLLAREHHISIFILFSHLKYNNFPIYLLNTLCKIQGGVSQVTNIIKIHVKLIGKKRSKSTWSYFINYVQKNLIQKQTFQNTSTLNCILHKNTRKHNQHFKLLFFKLSLHFGTSNWIFKYRNLNLLLIEGFYLAYSFLEMQIKLIKTKVYYKFYYSVWKETTHESTKMIVKTIFLQCICYWCNLARWLFFILY